MSTTFPAPAARQTGVLAAIATLHIGVFILVSAGIGIRPQLLIHVTEPIHQPSRPQVPTTKEPPRPFGAVEYVAGPVDEPIVVIPIFEDVAQATPSDRSTGPGAAGTGSAVPATDSRGPTLRTRDARLQALIDSCYPSVARRQAQEGRGVARVAVDATGRASGWVVEQSTGFAQLDLGMGCVARRVQFEPGRHDGRAVEASVLMPITFRLH